MSYFTDYLRNRRQQGLPMVPLSEGQQPMQPTLQGSEKMRQQSPLYNAGQFYSITPAAKPAEEQPKVDTSNAIGSLADLLGPTPAEREAQQARLERGRQQMTMWTGLIDGLRQLGNLYYTAKGARPQQFSDPYKMVDDTYQREAKRLDDLTAYRRAYANQLYNLQRQAGEDRRKDMLTAAQANYYDTRDEVARQKAELDKLKAVRVIKQKDGSLWKFDPVTGGMDILKESDPLYQEYMRASINQKNRMGYGRSGGGGRGGSTSTYGHVTRYHTDPETGDKIITRTPTTNGNQPRGQEKPTTKKVTQKKTAKPANKGNGGNNQQKRKSGTQL